MTPEDKKWAKLLHYLDRRFDLVDEQFSSLATKLDLQTNALDGIYKIVDDDEIA